MPRPLAPLVHAWGHAEWQFFQPFTQWQDFDSGSLLSATKIEYKLQGFVRTQLFGVVPQAGAETLVGSLHFDEPMHPPIERHNEINLAAFFIAKVENLPALAGRVFAKLRV